MNDIVSGGSQETKSTETTHVIYLDGLSFEIYHLNRRLYKFVDWKDARDKLIKIMLKIIKEKTGRETAYIEFKMANPMRKSRLGNFFIDIQADVLYGGNSLGTVEELGVKQLFTDRFDTLDEEESELRSSVEFKRSKEQYDNELILRIESLKSLNNQNGDGPFNCEESELTKIAENLMAKEGWSQNLDNRIHARRKRVSELS